MSDQKITAILLTAILQVYWLYALQSSCSIRYGQRSFRLSAPSVWSGLPAEQKNSDISRQGFKLCLKLCHFQLIQTIAESSGSIDFCSIHQSPTLVSRSEIQRS